MKFLFASDAFKGSLTSARIAELLEKAAKEVFADCECSSVTVADGGEGTVDAVVAAGNGRYVTACVHDPLMNPVTATYGVLDGGRAVIEMAAASGLPLVPVPLRNPLNTTTFGTGELIRHALDSGCKDISVAIGGSATNDGGMGCMRALGVRFLDADGNALQGCGSDLERVAHIDTDGLDKRLADCRITVMCVPHKKAPRLPISGGWRQVCSITATSSGGKRESTAMQRRVQALRAVWALRSWCFVTGR